jgi:hypothetical protein
MTSSKHKRKEPACTCLLCRPEQGNIIDARAHLKYGYDTTKVPAMKCTVCDGLIGTEPYVEEMGVARFGLMSFLHARCETAKMARARARMDKNWDKRR